MPWGCANGIPQGGSALHTAERPGLALLRWSGSVAPVLQDDDGRLRRHRDRVRVREDRAPPAGSPRSRPRHSRAVLRKRGASNCRLRESVRGHRLADAWRLRLPGRRHLGRSRLANGPGRPHEAARRLRDLLFEVRPPIFPRYWSAARPGPVDGARAGRPRHPSRPANGEGRRHGLRPVVAWIAAAPPAVPGAARSGDTP